MKICEKQSKKKARKIFGESAERLKAREKANAAEAKLGMDKKREEKKALWRQQSQQFQSAMQTAAAIANGEEPPPPLAEPEDSRIPCPHCGRKFEEAVAERHIPKCAQTKAKPNAVGTAMKRPSVSKGLSKPTGALSPPPAAEARLNPRQVVEAKKAAEKAAEMKKKAPPAKGGQRLTASASAAGSEKLVHRKRRLSR